MHGILEMNTNNLKDWNYSKPSGGLKSMYTHSSKCKQGVHNVFHVISSWHGQNKILSFKTGTTVLVVVKYKYLWNTLNEKNNHFH